MSKLEMARSLFAYNEWANNRILDAAARLADEERRRRSDLSPLGVNETLAHAAGTQIFWLREWREPGSFTEEWFTGLDSFEGVRKAYAASHREIAEFLAGLKEGDLERTVTPPEWWGDTPGVRFPLWHIMIQVAMHSQQHRAEIAQAISASESSPGDLDYIHFAIARHKAEWLE